MRGIDPKAFGARVAQRRKALNVSQKALAAAVSMKQQGIGNIEKGIVRRPRALIELAEALGTTRDWLLWGEGPEEVRPANPREQIASIIQNLDDAKLSLAVQFLKNLAEDNTRAA